MKADIRIDTGILRFCGREPDDVLLDSIASDEVSLPNLVSLMRTLVGRYLEKDGLSWSS